MSINLTNGDMVAISEENDEHIHNIGAEYYREGEYEKAIEYYRISSIMGNDQSIANLGYCYLYGRAVEKNEKLAIVYFKLAASRDNVDALYKLGDMYNRGLGVGADKDIAQYYFKRALDVIVDENYSLRLYPSLCLAMAHELMPGGSKQEDLLLAYDFLTKAKEGYEIAIENGEEYYKASLDKTNKLLENSIFDNVKEEYEEYTEEFEEE